MRFKYYLRGIGIGILFSTIVLSISFLFHKPKISDEEIIIRAKELGMELVEDSEEKDSKDTLDNNNSNTEKLGQESKNTQKPKDTDLTDENVPNEDANDSTSVVITIKKGEVCRTLAEDLESHGLIEDAEDFRIYMGKKGKDDDIKAGDFVIPYGASYDEIISILMK